MPKKRGPVVGDKIVRERQKYDRMAVLERFRLVVHIMQVQADWKQGELARKAGLTSSKLSHYMSGRYRPDLDSVASIAERLGVSMEWLVFGSGPMWARDLEFSGLGLNECVLAVSSVLDDFAAALSRTVLSPPDAGKDELGIEAAIRGLLSEKVAHLAAS